LLTFGGENGMVECWDPRCKKRVAIKDIGSAVSFDTRETDKINCEITSLKSDIDGITLGIGTSNGYCLLYDLRASQPLHIKDHQYGYPIKRIDFYNKKVISTDTKILKIWNREENIGKIFASIEPPADVNDVCLVPSSGLIHFACDQSKMLSYFIPELGPAPKWCSFLDSLTEELEEDKQILYDDYKFVTKQELSKLGLSKLIGTDYLRAYMHGFFMNMKLYNKMRAISEPFEYDEYRKAKIKERIEKESTTRVSAKKQLPKVNANIAARILADKKGNTIMEDPRFGEMFNNPEFAVNEYDDRYQQYRFRARKLSEKDIQEHFES